MIRSLRSFLASFSNLILMHFEDFFNLILIINLGDQMLVPQVNNHKLSMGLSFISSFIYFGEEPMEDVSNPTKLYFLLPFLQWLEE